MDPPKLARIVGAVRGQPPESASARSQLGIASVTDSRTGVSPYGFVRNDLGRAQHLPDGTVRPLPFPGSLTRVGDTWLVYGEGQIAMLNPNGSNAVLLEVPDVITEFVPPADSSPWVILVPDFQGQDTKRLYALDTTDGSWFTTGVVSSDRDPHKVSVRSGLAVTRSSEYGPVEFMRAGWDVARPTGLDQDGCRSRETGLG